MLMKAEALVRMRYGLQPIVARITLKERHDVSVLHPWGNQAKAWSKQVPSDTQEWKNVWVLQVPPQKGFATEVLKVG